MGISLVEIDLYEIELVLLVTSELRKVYRLCFAYQCYKTKVVNSNPENVFHGRRSWNLPYILPISDHIVVIPRDDQYN